MGNNEQMVSVPLRLNEQQARDVQRFYDTCEDGQGYDVPKDRMKALARIGLVRSLGFGRYELTDVGCAAVNGLHDKVAQHHGEPSAPVERDERADFERKFVVQEGVFFSGERNEYRSMNGRAVEETDATDLNLRLSGWQARAALERKPSVDIDRIALNCASEIMGLFFGPILPGGKVQLKAGIQCRVISALQRKP